MGISINGPSGIDTQALIDSLVALEQNKVSKVQSQKDVYQKKISAYSKIGSFISELKSAISQLKKDTDFNLFTSKSSNTDIVNITPSTNGSPGNYEIGVFALATKEKLISKDKLITSQTEPLSQFGITDGSFSINGTTISVSATDSIQDVRFKINSATATSGKKIGVTASVVKVAENNYRLVLTNTETGKAGAEYKDIDTGTVLQKLGIITKADGDNKGISYQQIGSGEDVKTAFTNLASGQTITFTGKDHSGRDVTTTFVKTADTTMTDMLSQISQAFRHMATASINEADGKLILTDEISGGSQLAVTSFSIGGTPVTMSATTIGSHGSNLISAGVNSYFSIDGLYMNNSQNSITDAVAGATITLNKVSGDSIVNVSQERDYDGLIKKFETVINAYNAFAQYVSTATAYGDSKKNENNGVISGDMTARALVQQVRSIFQQNIKISGTETITNLSDIGISTDTQTGGFSLDKTKLKNILTSSFDSVKNFFVTQSYTDNANIKVGKFSDKTTSGVYTLTEQDSTHYAIQRTKPTESDSVVSDERDGDIVSFSTGPAEGLSLTAAAGSGNATVTFSRGFSDQLDFLLKKLSDSKDGTIALRKNSMTDASNRIDKRIESMNARIAVYKEQLVKEYANMERVLNNLKGQSSSMLSQLGIKSST